MCYTWIKGNHVNHVNHVGIFEKIVCYYHSSPLYEALLTQLSISKFTIFFIVFNVAVTVIEISRPTSAIKSSKIWYAIKPIKALTKQIDTIQILQLVEKWSWIRFIVKSKCWRENKLWHIINEALCTNYKGMTMPII